MKRYIGTKTIQAEPMHECRFLEEEKKIDTRNRENRPGYKVVYSDGHVSWSPKEVFEKAYHELLHGDEDHLTRILLTPVFPSNHCTIAVADDPDYGGAHRYQFKNSLGYSNGQAEYDNDSFQEIQFVQKNADGSMTPGLQNEQLVIALIDRTKKLNKRFPSVQNEMMLKGLNLYLEACMQRIQDRIDRGVMGDLKK